MQFELPREMFFDRMQKIMDSYNSRLNNSVFVRATIKNLDATNTDNCRVMITLPLPGYDNNNVMAIQTYDKYAILLKDSKRNVCTFQLDRTFETFEGMYMHNGALALLFSYNLPDKYKPLAWLPSGETEWNAMTAQRTEDNNND